ncbi:MAG: LLM class flavin-dependent oxidoreductase [Gaiellaceae bacterium]
MSAGSTELRKFRVGVQLPEVERVVRRDELAAMARAAEECGFDSLWVGDHLLYRGDGRGERGPWDCWTTLAWLAGLTERVELGPLVACTAFHPPGVLARQTAAVHELSGGRLVAAFGAGWNQEEFRAFGLPFDHHVSRFEEAFTIARRLLAGERVTFEGRFHSVDDAVLLPPLARVPKLMIGANAPRMLSIALPHVDAWNTWFTPYGNTPEGFEVHNAEISAAAERAGRDPGAIERSACVLVEVDGAGERPRDVPAVPAAELGDHLRALAEAGADEAILVLDPITESSIRLVSDTLGGVRPRSDGLGV